MSDVCARRLAAACLVACSFLGSVRLCAQATGAVAGLVSDASGGVLPGVTIDVANQDTGQVRTAVTANDGFYTVPLLNPGRYQVQATLAGFRTTIRDGIVVVVVNETARADLQLHDPVHRQCRRRFHARVPGAVSPGERRSEPGWVVVGLRRLRPGRIPRVAGDVELRRALRAQSTVCRAPGSSERVSSRPAVADLPHCADRPGLSR